MPLNQINVTNNATGNNTAAGGVDDQEKPSFLTGGILFAGLLTSAYILHKYN